MTTPEIFSPESSRRATVEELTTGGALPPEGFTQLEDALASLKEAGDTVDGKMKDGIGEWKVTRGATEADFTIQSGGDYDETN